MRYRFPHDFFPPVDIPGENLVGIFEAGQEKPSQAPKEIIERALAVPIGAPPIAAPLFGPTRCC